MENEDKKKIVADGNEENGGGGGQRGGERGERGTHEDFNNSKSKRKKLISLPFDLRLPHMSW